MKKLIVICLVFTLIESCKSKPNPETKAVKAINDYLKTHLNDYSSYESVETEIDSAFTNREDKHRTMREEAKLVRDKFVKDSAALAREDMRLPPIEQEILIPVFSGWTVYHKFRSKNGFGAKVLEYYKFRMDTNYKIVGIVNMDNE